jgi:hypothetical protein
MRIVGAAGITEHSREGFQRAGAGLLSELETSWQLLSRLSDELSQSSSPLRESSTFSGTLHDTHAWYEETSSQLLARPVDQFLKLRPIERALEALQASDRETDAKTIRLRTKIDNHFERLLVRAALDLCEPWRIWRAGNHAREWEAWDQRRIRRSRDAAKLLDRYADWAARSIAVTPDSGQFANDAATERRWRRRNAVTAT